MVGHQLHYLYVVVCYEVKQRNITLLRRSKDGEEENCEVLCGNLFDFSRICFFFFKFLTNEKYGVERLMLSLIRLSKAIQLLFVFSTTTTTARETTRGFSLSPPNSTSPKLVFLLPSLVSMLASVSGGLPL